MRYRLGLDLGANSLGWAVLELESKVPWYDAKPIGIVATGVRMFDAGVDGSIEQGKDSSRGAERRQARQTRRQTWRRQYRKSKLFGLLQRLNHLPKTENREPDVRDTALKSLDESLTAKWCPEGDIDAHQKMPYLLRAAALDQLLEPHELGRALYHLGQRRGYKPNRKTDIADDEESGKVATGISTLDRARRVNPDDPATERTLAQTVRDEFGQVDGRFVLKSEDPASATRGRIRKHYTSRKMYYDEFIAIRDAQLRFGTSIQIADWKRIEKALFHQRPLKSQKHLVGRCTLEEDNQGRGRRRCTIAMLDFQEFRLLQTVNHLRIVLPGEPSQPVTDEQRQILVDHLQTHGDLLLQPPRRRSRSGSVASVISLLDLPKGTSFSLTPFQDAGDTNDEADEDDDKKLIGNSTAAKLRPILADRWDRLTDAEREQLILQVLYISNPESLKKLAIRKWQLSPDAAEALSLVRLEEGFGALSKVAIQRLLPKLRHGMNYSTAVEAVYGKQSKEMLDLLPPLLTWNSDIGNPAVIRALSELRKVVNSIIRKYGKPEEIHIELSRDLKKSRDARRDIYVENQKREKARRNAQREILQELGEEDPRPELIEKWLLLEELGGPGAPCPYTGKAITARNLANFDVEHIFPRRFLDDSFANKTLCDAEFNRNRKRDCLPSEVLLDHEIDAVIARVKKFHGQYAESKLKRFLATEVPKEFVARQLNDTQYNARLASQYLGTLFGGSIDAVSRKQRIVAPTGKHTWLLRLGLGLQAILNSGATKDRSDNRHHAIDAVCVALCDMATIQRISNIAAHSFDPHRTFRRFLRQLPPPEMWPTIVRDVQSKVLEIVVSHRPNRSIAGPLHGGTIYSKAYSNVDDSPNGPNKGRRSKTDGKPKHRIRMQLCDLDPETINGDSIVDPAVRLAVQRKYQELCDLFPKASDHAPKKLWSDLSAVDRFPSLEPSRARVMKGHNTHGSKIYRVRVWEKVNPRLVGKGVKARFVAGKKDTNFAMLIYGITDHSGAVLRWERELITRMEAHVRLRKNGGGQRHGFRGARRLNRPHGEPLNAVPERVLTSMTAVDSSASHDAPFQLKSGETAAIVAVLRKNDMLEIDSPIEGRTICRVLSFSAGENGFEIQLCPHQISMLEKSARGPWRFQSLNSFRQRHPTPVEVGPLGDVLRRG